MFKKKKMNREKVNDLKTNKIIMFECALTYEEDKICQNFRRKDEDEEDIEKMPILEII